MQTDRQQQRTGCLKLPVEHSDTSNSGSLLTVAAG